VGTHAGAELLTLGQKARIGGAKRPYFVVARPPPRAFTRDPVGSDYAPTCLWGSPVGVLCLGDVLVAAGQDHPALYCDTLHVRHTAEAGDEEKIFSWVAGKAPDVLLRREAGREGFYKCYARTRHGLPLAACRISLSSSRSATLPRNRSSLLELSHVVGFDAGQDEVMDLLTVTFDEPQRALTPGQVVALYTDRSDDSATGGIPTGTFVCLGGGPIYGLGPSEWEKQHYGHS